MKHNLFFGILLIFVFSLCFSQTIVPHVTIFDYGKIKKGDNGLKKFIIQNKGDKPLIISNVKTTCDCTIPSWPKKPILPNKEAIIEVKYDTKKIGTFSKSIEVFSNDPKKSRIVLKIKGIVE